MNPTFNTQNADASIALKALQHYRMGEFEQAIATLLDVLDSEPENWQARLMLAVCHYKTNQFSSAQWAFRLIYERAADESTRKKGLEGLQATRAKLMECPAEHAAFFERNMPHEPFFAWLDSLMGPPVAARRGWRPSYNR